MVCNHTWLNAIFIRCQSMNHLLSLTLLKCLEHLLEHLLPLTLLEYLISLLWYPFVFSFFLTFSPSFIVISCVLDLGSKVEKMLDLHEAYNQVIDSYSQILMEKAKPRSPCIIPKCVFSVILMDEYANFSYYTKKQAKRKPLTPRQQSKEFRAEKFDRPTHSTLAQTR